MNHIARSMLLKAELNDYIDELAEDERQSQIYRQQLADGVIGVSPPVQASPIE